MRTFESLTKSSKPLVRCVLGEVFINDRLEDQDICSSKMPGNGARMHVQLGHSTLDEREPEARALRFGIWVPRQTDVEKGNTGTNVDHISTSINKLQAFFL